VSDFLQSAFQILIAGIQFPSMPHFPWESADFARFVRLPQTFDIVPTMRSVAAGFRSPFSFALAVRASRCSQRRQLFLLRKNCFVAAALFLQSGFQRAFSCSDHFLLFISAFAFNRFGAELLLKVFHNALVSDHGFSLPHGATFAKFFQIDLRSSRRLRHPPRNPLVSWFILLVYRLFAIVSTITEIHSVRRLRRFQQS
jgi:hypothetical protein